MGEGRGQRSQQACGLPNCPGLYSKNKEHRRVCEQVGDMTLLKFSHAGWKGPGGRQRPLKSAPSPAWVVSCVLWELPTPFPGELAH